MLRSRDPPAGFYRNGPHPPFAGVAQSVEQLIRNQQVSGSSPLTSSKGKHPKTLQSCGFTGVFPFLRYCLFWAVKTDTLLRGYYVFFNQLINFFNCFEKRFGRL